MHTTISQSEIYLITPPCRPPKLKPKPAKRTAISDQRSAISDYLICSVIELLSKNVVVNNQQLKAMSQESTCQCQSRSAVAVYKDDEKVRSGDGCCLCWVLDDVR
jgi:hypothetical protein